MCVPAAESLLSLLVSVLVAEGHLPRHRGFRELHRGLWGRGSVGVESELWGGGVTAETMSAAERAAYEDKKLKMRKAMGENLGDAVAGETVDAKQRRCYRCPPTRGVQRLVWRMNWGPRWIHQPVQGMRSCVFSGAWSGPAHLLGLRSDVWTAP